MQIKELGHVVLYVSEIGKMADFYQHVLGFNLISRAGPLAAFSGGRTHHELLLIEVGKPAPYPAGNPGVPGLYHIGFKAADTPAELKEVYQELKDKRVRMVGTSDHGVTHSIYI